MKEMDPVRVTLEKEKYAREGVHKGMEGFICLDDNTNGKWLVNFPQYGAKEDIAEICIHEDDLEVIPVMRAKENERIKAEWEKKGTAITNGIQKYPRGHFARGDIVYPFSVSAGSRWRTAAAAA